MQNKTAIILTLALAIGLPLVGDEKKDASEQQVTKEEKTAPAADKPAANESPLVKAARESKARRDGDKSRISITNEDVKKSEGKLIQSTTKPLDPLPSTTPTQDEMRQVAAANSRKASRAQLEELVEKHQKEVTNLEKELRRIEETYYNEDDPDYREDVLSSNFDDTKAQLEAARKELAAARKALAATGGN